MLAKMPGLLALLISSSFSGTVDHNSMRLVLFESYRRAPFNGYNMVV